MVPDPDHSLDLDELERIDSICARFERSWPTLQIEELLGEVVGALRSELLRSLLVIEIELRAGDGVRVDPDSLSSRFPDDTDTINAAVAVAKERGLLPGSDDKSLTETAKLAVEAAELLTSRDELSSGKSQAIDKAVEDDEPIPERLGRYQIQRVLGRGAFGVVYLAYDPQLDRSVALKVPRRKRFQGSQQVSEFVDEARKAAQLQHPSLVVVHDVQEEDGLPYIVQEYIDGKNLAAWAAEHRPSIEQIAQLFVAISDALAYAHGQGLTHCDLKLANVLVDSSGAPHVADFGLAVHESTQADRRGQQFGTPAMMAPEQVRGEGHRLDGRTDIWAVGVMLYELLTARRPFDAGDREELFDQILTLDPRPPRQIDRNIPRELERICFKCLSRRRTERYATTDDLREDLRAWISTVSSTPDAEKHQGAAIDFAPKYYVYVSRAKVELLSSQLPESLITKGTDQRSLYANTAAVVEHLESQQLIGDVENPKAYFRGTMDLRWGRLGGAKAVYFGGETESTILGLGGSIRHVIGQVGDSDADAFSYTFKLIELLLDETEGHLPESWKQRRDFSVGVAEASTWMRGPLERVEFVARKLLAGDSTDSAKKVLLGSPIYAALVDH